MFLELNWYFCSLHLNLELCFTLWAPHVYAVRFLLSSDVPFDNYMKEPCVTHFVPASL